jgi:hypothetical protein
MLAYSEAISVARSFAQKHNYEIDPTRELTALGAANIATGIVHGCPVAGGMSQTAVNDMGGATSSVALIATLGAIAFTLLFFSKILSQSTRTCSRRDRADGCIAPGSFRRRASITPCIACRVRGSFAGFFRRDLAVWAARQTSARRGRLADHSH